MVPEIASRIDKAIPAKPARQEGFAVDYHDEVTEEQVRKIDKHLEEEFRDGEWVTVERES